MLGVQAAAAGLADGVPRTPDPLQRTRDRAGRLHQQHQVHRTHVDAQLQRTGGDDGADRTGLERRLDLRTPLQRQAAVVGEHQFLSGQLVEPLHQPLAQAAAVDEDDGRAVRADLRQQFGLDHRPHAPLRRRSALTFPRFAGRLKRRGHRRCHVRHRHADGEIQQRRRAGVDHLDFPLTGEETRRLRRGSHGGRQADALRLGCGQLAQPLQRQREVHAALAAGQHVQLVDDDGVHAGEGRTRLRTEQQEQRFRGGHQYLRRLARLARALALRRVAGAHRDTDRTDRRLQTLGAALHARQRAAQVALYVVDQRLQRRHVQHPYATLLGEAAPRHAVQRVQEGRQRLAAAGCRNQQCMAAGGDRLPAASLDLGGYTEGFAEPVARGAAEGLETFARARLVAFCLLAFSLLHCVDSTTVRDCPASEFVRFPWPRGTCAARRGFYNAHRPRPVAATTRVCRWIWWTAFFVSSSF